MRDASSDSEFTIEEIRDFTHEGELRFSFKYPVFKDWDVSKPDPKSTPEFTLMKINSKFASGSSEPPKIAVQIDSSPGIRQMMEKDKKNPQGINYNYVYSPTYKWGGPDGTITASSEHKHTLYFFAKDKTVLVIWNSVMEDDGFSSKAFKDKIVESFKF